MYNVGYWKLCNSYSVIQAAHLITGVDLSIRLWHFAIQSALNRMNLI
jgi:hypothetical protein